MLHCCGARVSAVPCCRADGCGCARVWQLAVKVAKAAQQVRRSSQVHSALAIAAMRNETGMEDDDDDEVGMAYGCAVVACVCMCVCGRAAVCVALCVWRVTQLYCLPGQVHTLRSRHRFRRFSRRRPRR